VRAPHGERDDTLRFRVPLDTFERRVQPFIKVVPCGQLVLIPPGELERWVASNARYIVDGAA
jgi:hypothetical protein